VRERWERGHTLTGRVTASGLSGGAGQGGWRGAGEAGCGRQGVVSAPPPHPARQGAKNTGTPDGPDGRVHPASQAPTLFISPAAGLPTLIAPP
jgi:hypothetical protein